MSKAARGVPASQGAQVTDRPKRSTIASLWPHSTTAKRVSLAVSVSTLVGLLAAGAVELWGWARSAAVGPVEARVVRVERDVQEARDEATQAAEHAVAPLRVEVQAVHDDVQEVREALREIREDMRAGMRGVVREIRRQER